MKYLFELINKCQVSCIEELGATSFLFNNNFKIGNSIIDNKILRNNGIYFVHQLMEDSNFLSQIAFNQKYNLQIDFLTYHSIIRCIKTNSSFDDLEKIGKKIQHQPAYGIILKDKKGASTIYRELLPNFLECKGRTKWINSTILTEDEWLGSFNLLKNTTHDTKL